VKPVSRIIFILLLLTGLQAQSQCPGSDYTSGQQQFSVGLSYTHYVSFSQLKTSTPMHAGYPSFYATAPEIQGTWIWKRPRLTHHFRINTGLYSRLLSDDGLGNNELLDPDKSHLYSVFFQYYFLRNLFHLWKIHSRFGFSSGLLYENRQLDFKGSTQTKKAEMTTALGVILNGKYPVSRSFGISGQFNALFFIPYLSYGKYRMYDAGNEIFQSDFYTFAYNTIVKVGLSYQLGNRAILTAGYSQNNRFGFSNGHPSFVIDHLITYRMERLHQIFIAYTFAPRQ
jgi:hypothetical protein